MLEELPLPYQISSRITDSNKTNDIGIEKYI